jgi:hypothetical protein
VSSGLVGCSFLPLVSFLVVFFFAAMVFPLCSDCRRGRTLRYMQNRFQMSSPTAPPLIPRRMLRMPSPNPLDARVPAEKSC